jgi:PAS domain S-box-containing protein
MTILPSASLEAFYRELTEGLPVGMAIVHMQNPRDVSTWKTIAVNSMAAETIGSSIEDLLAMPALERSNHFDWTDTQQLYSTIVESRTSKVLGHVERSGSSARWRICSVTAFPLAGNCLGLMVQDDTPWRDTQGELLKAKLRVRHVCETVRVIAWTAVPETLEFTQVNKEAEDILGYWIERWFKETSFWKNRTHPDDWEQVAALCADVAKHGNPREFGCRMFAVDGTLHDFYVTAQRVVVPPNQIRLSGVMNDVTEQKRIEEQARQLSSSLLRSQDQERKRISRELHDSIGQHLTGMKLHLEVLKRARSSMDTELQNSVTECMDILINCMTEVRNVCNLLHPSMLEELGLASALRSLVEGFSRRSGLKLRLEVPEKIEGLSSEVQLTLFRVVQECITNVCKHAHSDSATIRFARDNGHIRLQVEDYGIGLSSTGAQPDGSAPVNKGLGIRGMRERIHELGGKLDISSNGIGTSVRIAIPIYAPLADKKL